MLYSIQDIAQIIQAQWLQSSNPEAGIEHLLFDSRQVAAPDRSLFFALAGERQDGHRYLADLYKAGVRHFVVSKPVQVSDFPNANILLVSDTLRALQALAQQHRKQFHIPVVAITGSNGKTVVKEWLWQLLSPDFHIVRSPKSYNSQIGVPLSVWQMRPEHTLALFEAGISKPGEMQHLAGIIQPEIGVFTNIGPAHREGFRNDEEKIREKMRLFDSARVLVVCADQPAVLAEAQVWQRAQEGRQLFTWSTSGQAADVQVIGIQPVADGFLQIRAAFRQMIELGVVEIPFSDPASLENAIHCWAVMHLLGVPQKSIAERMRRLEPVEMRLELKSGIRHCTLVNDFYNNDLASLRIALQFARHQARTGKFTLILSDILQSGLSSNDLWAEVADSIRLQGVSRLIGIGADISAIREHLGAGFDAAFYPDTTTFLQNIAVHDFHDELILLKGARPFEFERIARRLEQKAHKTLLEVNLTAMVHNLNAYQRLLKPGTRTMAMVKAAGYGSGSSEVAKMLEFHRIDYLGVAYADEGIELRHSGVNLPILVLNPEPASFDAMYRFRLEPEVYSLPMLDELIHYAGKDKNLSIHLKMDTGMHRLGFEAEDISELTTRLLEYPNLRVQTIFSHLSASDATQHDAFTHRQAATFRALSDQVGAVLGYMPVRHICNTGGIVRFPEYHFDMVRLGIGLYGIDSAGLQDQLRVVNTLKATISQIKEIPPGDTVGYNRNSGPLAHPTRIATISIGYADGFLRLAGGGRYSVLVRGERAPTIGNVCMDMTMVDITHIEAAREGDEVVIFGENPPVQELSACLQTIPYEVFTNISERVKRVYWQE
ncbi:MAG: bifunctional UDP-N-acetylmuramoyl-tripeptide:D-alanyl-D-alanine ligase/alanine racemase [Bacteroidetes bacterium]|nr:bifunctional UDP-N-acetylmuramoyl-tripeptide:D-alanyl-D-alanine ligase/alanine racemase [Bacteroidota bacterium]